MKQSADVAHPAALAAAATAARANRIVQPMDSMELGKLFIDEMDRPRAARAFVANRDYVAGHLGLVRMATSRNCLRMPTPVPRAHPRLSNMQSHSDSKSSRFGPLGCMGVHFFPAKVSML